MLGYHVGFEYGFEDEFSLVQFIIYKYGIEYESGFSERSGNNKCN